MPNRSSKTGKYVTKKYASKHKATTVKEKTDPVRKQLLNAVALLVRKKIVNPIGVGFMLRSIVDSRYPAKKQSK